MTVAGLDVREIPLAKLARADWNANRVPEETLAKVRHSVETFGVVENLVVRPHPSERGKFEVLSGNHRLALYAELGLASAPCHVVKLDDGRARVLAQVLNRTRGEDDPDAYRALMTTVLAQVERDEILALLPETERSLKQLEEETRRLVAFQAGEGGEDDVPEPPKIAKSKPGEVYELGAHVLVCGDSTDADVAALAQAGGASLVWTDPPYGIAYKALRRDDEIAGDATAETARPLIASALAHASGAKAWFVCCDWRSVGTISEAMADAGIEAKACIVWDKTRGVQNLDRFHKQHEMVVYAGPYGGEQTVDGDVWQIARDFTPDHPTPKPVEIIERSLRAAAVASDVVYDPFGGSGSTLIAAENFGIAARLVELSPAYCDVIRQRYADHVGRPELAP